MLLNKKAKTSRSIALLLCIAVVLGFTLYQNHVDIATSALLRLGLPHTPLYHLKHGTDSHDGFQGDGSTFYSFFFKESIANDLKALANQSDSGWYAFPMNKAFRLMLYGGDVKGTCYQPYTTQIPDVKSGYWFFESEPIQSASLTQENLLSIYQSPSANFTLAVYDDATNILYYLKFDS